MKTEIKMFDKDKFYIIRADIITFFRHSSKVFCECFSNSMEIFTKNFTDCKNNCIFTKY